MIGVLSACTSPTPAPTTTPEPPKPPTETPRPGRQIFEWPPQSGYITTPAHKPSSTISEYTAFTDWEIWGIIEGNIEANGEIEYYNSKSLAFAFGAKITNRNRLGTPVTIKDYNGDECVIPYGMTVKVDAYGQFQPYWYDPQLAPVPTDTPMPTATAESTSDAGTNLQQQFECAELDLSPEELANCGKHEYLFTGKIVDEYGGYDCHYDDATGVKTAQDTVNLLVDFSVKDSLTIEGVSWVLGESGATWERIDQNHYSWKIGDEELTLSSSVSFTATGFTLDFIIAQTGVACKDGSKCGCTYHEEYDLVK